MLKIDTTDLDNFIRELQSINGQQLKEKYFEYLKNEVKIGTKLRKNIEKLVYSTPEPKMYQRTQRLLGAIRVKKEGEQLLLYMDDEWLEQQKEGFPSDHTGWGKYAAANHGEPSKSYAERVESGYTFQNIYYPRDSTQEIPPRKYFKVTMDEIEERLDKVANGSQPPQIILEPLLKVW